MPDDRFEIALGALDGRIVVGLDEAGFPPGVINLVQGAGETGEALVNNPDVNIVLFTGSYDVGHRIQQLSAEFYDRIIACEMGSKSAVIVCEDARLDLAVTAAVISAFKTSGQRCVSGGRAIVHESLVEPFCNKLVALATEKEDSHESESEGVG